MAWCLAVDTEFTGPNLIQHSLVNVGAVLINPQGKVEKSLDLLLNLREGTTWNKKTLNEFWRTNDNLRSTVGILVENKALDYSQAMDILEKFLIDCGNITVLKDEFDPERDSLVILADRTHVDITWINFYLNLCGKPGKEKNFFFCSNTIFRNTRLVQLDPTKVSW